MLYMLSPLEVALSLHGIMGVPGQRARVPFKDSGQSAVERGVLILSPVCHAFFPTCRRPRVGFSVGWSHTTRVSIQTRIFAVYPHRRERSRRPLLDQRGPEAVSSSYAKLAVVQLLLVLVRGRLRKLVSTRSSCSALRCDL